MTRQLVVASEYGEPSNHIETILQRLYAMKTDICLLLITKNLPGCRRILDLVSELKTPMQIHCTITGLGGTKLEPHILGPDYMVKESIGFLEEYRIDPKAVTIRIDPIIPEFLDLQIVEAKSTLEAFSGIGVKDCRISVVDYYPHVKVRLDLLGIEYSSTFQVGIPLKNLIIDRISFLTVPLGMRLHLCAEGLPFRFPIDSIDTEGCASAASWERLGITDLKPATRKQRKDCTCNLSKQDLLAGLSKGCPNGCAYCYWR